MAMIPVRMLAVSLAMMLVAPADAGLMESLRNYWTTLMGHLSGRQSTLNEHISSATSTDNTCTGIECCPSSSCFRLPGLGCSSARGDTSCVGGGMFSRGVCSCTGNVACNAQGNCPATLLRMYDDDSQMTPVTVHPEDFTLAFGVYITAGVGMVVGGLMLGFRHHRRSSTPSTQARMVRAQETDELEAASESDGIVE